MRYHAHAAKQLRSHAETGATVPFSADEAEAEARSLRARAAAADHLRKHGPNKVDGKGFLDAARGAVE